MIRARALLLVGSLVTLACEPNAVQDRPAWLEEMRQTDREHRKQAELMAGYRATVRRGRRWQGRLRELDYLAMELAPPPERVVDPGRDPLFCERLPPQRRISPDALVDAYRHHVQRFVQEPVVFTD